LIRYRTRDRTRLIREECACGRTMVRMDRILGRTDDMLIVSGVNVFPSQVEHVLTKVEGLTPNYVIVVDKKGVLDVLEVWVEVDERIFTGDLGSLENLKHKLEEELANHLFLRARVKLVEPKTLERSMGKAKRVIDRRELEQKLGR